MQEKGTGVEWHLNFRKSFSRKVIWTEKASFVIRGVKTTPPNGNEAENARP